LIDGEAVVKYLMADMAIPAISLILFGRSLGSGPATELASIIKPAALLLMTAYTSIKGLIRSLAGRVAAFLIYDRFRNIDHI
jgi:hypothetical protein